MAYEQSIHTLLNEVIRRNASDLHLSVGIPPALRIDGDLVYVGGPTNLTNEDIRRMVTEVLTRQKLAQFEEEWELDFSFTFKVPGGDSARFRGNCFFERGSLAAAFRMIPTQVRSAQQLMLPKCLDDIASKQRGIFLVTGPTGSGKSTTLAALMQQINTTRRSHVITIEDPVEYLFKSEKCIIQQREVGLDTKSFANSLKRSLRQDPDVIMIGEMRDLETISAAITAAETGHLVLTTLHTPDAVQSIDRIIDVFPPYQQQQVRMQLSHVLIGVFYQQLIPLMGGGRIVATEVLFATPAVRNCIREGKTAQIRSVMQTSGGQNMHTMDQDLARLVWDGFLSSEQAMQYSMDPKELERILMDMSPVARRNL